MAHDLMLHRMHIILQVDWCCFLSAHSTSRVPHCHQRGTYKLL